MPPLPTRAPVVHWYSQFNVCSTSRLEAYRWTAVPLNRRSPNWNAFDGEDESLGTTLYRYWYDAPAHLGSSLRDKSRSVSKSQHVTAEPSDGYGCWWLWRQRNAGICVDFASSFLSVDIYRSRDVRCPFQMLIEYDWALCSSWYLPLMDRHRSRSELQ
jgi:hypothetical protein